MTLDMEARTLSFVINGREQGVMFRNLKPTTYRLALAVSACNGSQFELS